jgi:cell wall-associated NlpC family hydrolase
MCTLGFVLGGAPLAEAQGPVFETTYGVWLPGDSNSVVFRAGVVRPALGPLGWGFGFVHVRDSRDTLARTLSGGEFSVSLGRDGAGPYALASTGIGILHRGGADAFWSAGAGYAVRLFSLLTLGVETRYRVEDSRVRGFWQLEPGDRRGLEIAGRLAFGLGAGPSAAGTGTPPALQPADGTPPRVEPAPPPGKVAATGSLPADPYTAARSAGASEEAARLSATVVETALAAMGAPYRWGGTDGNGFDCSGLIQYAYGQHGVVLPRVSRDQARMGRAVDRGIDGLRPGDILAFSDQGTSRVTHVGLYVGDGQFLHSSSTGVKLSDLREGGESRWWRDRWVGVRRIVE